VLVSAPADGADLTVVYGVNHDKLTKDISSSRTPPAPRTACPGGQGAERRVGIEKGFMTTIHSYTATSRRSTDAQGPLPRPRRGAVMIPTSTGAAKAVGLVLPELNGKLDGTARSACRRPTSPWSTSSSSPSEDDEGGDQRRHHRRRRRPAEGRPRLHRRAERLDRLQPRPHSSIFHLDQTKVIDGNFVRVLSWYDNEWGFSNRMSDNTRDHENAGSRQTHSLMDLGSLSFS
jgi:glyceraldehyde 3-phosphate dehydrogenase